MIRKVISGGQTGVDRAALDVAIGLGIPHGGFCPNGRRAEDGRIPDRYELEECASGRYRKRTALNVEHSDATLVLTRGEPTGGTRLTIDLCAARQKPLFVLQLDGPLDVAAFLDWLRTNRVAVLNVAGPRESQQPGIGKVAAAALTSLLQEL